MRGCGLVGCLLACLAFSAPASAHRLRLFATVDEGALAGYAFFVGGGRAQGAEIVVTSSPGAEPTRLLTDQEGRFSWKPPAPATYHVVVSTGDGHVSEATVERSRFGGDEPVAASTQPAVSPTAPPRPDETALARLVEQKVDAAVARQLRPLLEAYGAAEARLRFNDIMGGIGMIVGLAGIALWGASRRRRNSGASS
ncbi:MAG: hypothetical protein JWL93_561 [Hyphomicrobiales bacterium]|jgi:nickel transport protein|nr:hypothetical protein [Hyphomicrobiales bacterium]